MAELSFRRSASQSSIPVVTPRPSRSSISSNFPASQTSLVSQFRRMSESTAKPGTASSSTPTLSQPPVSSIPSLRSIRNLLPFAPAKTANPPPSPAHTPRPSIVNFGSLRRLGHDRKNPRPQEADQTPVIAIGRPTFEEEMMARKRSRDVTRSTSDPTPSSRTSEERYVLPLPSPVQPLGADLSTIIEAEYSGISKHIPSLGDATHDNGDDDTPTSPFNLEQIDKSKSPLPSPISRAASVLDLSTSRLDAEVMLALKVEDATTASEWLNAVNGVVVEGDVDEPDTPLRNPGYPARDDTALDFDSVDPDLAQLLSPNRINGKSRIPSPVASHLPSRAHAQNTSDPAPTPSHRPLNGDGLSSRASPSPYPSLVPPSVSRAAVRSPSPTRRSASLSRAGSTSSPSALPRLIRSVTAAPPGPGMTDPPAGTSTPSGLHPLSKKRHQPPSPLSSQSHSSQGPSSASSRGSTDIPPRKSTSSRLATPNRLVSSYAPGNSRLADPTPSLQPSPDETTSSTQHSPRSASDPTREPNSRPSLEFGGPLVVNKRRRPHLFSTRRRSMSVEDARVSSTSGSASPIRPSSSLSNRPVMDWLGPRTAKAFAAAGLLDSDRDVSNAHPSGASKYATLRNHGEREDRFVPSRLAFSEAASSSSWGRSGSVSRGMTPSEGGITWGSPTFSAPRTTISSSTAPTSISTTSSSQQATLQLMKEKHDLETEALLSALSDSQRTTKTLREENLQLRGRIRNLEDELDEMRTQIHRLASGVFPPRPSLSGTFSRSPFDRSLRSPSPLVTSRRPSTAPRPLPHVNAGGLTLSVEDHSPRSSRAASPSHRDSPAPAALAPSRPRRRRASTSSSVFPAVPQNMSLLMLEDRPGPLSTPSSPIPQRSNICDLSGNAGQGHVSGHATHLHKHYPSSLSPGALNVSPTITSFSMTEIPGSPTSLQLRPEHELHLGDMTTLSLYAMSDEEL